MREGWKLPIGLPTAGTMLRLIRDGLAATRADLVELTGLSRSTVSQRVDALISSRLVREVSEGLSTGGRPPAVLAFDQGAGVILAADLGATHSRIAVTDLGGVVLSETTADMDIADGPAAVLDWLDENFMRLLVQARRKRNEVRGIGIGVPGPVEFATGRPVSPPIMPGWDGYPIPERFEGFNAPVLVDNDVNIMALGEHWSNWRDCEHLVFVKVGTGIGCGIVADRRIHRGAEGAAGDIGHIRVTDDPTAACSCGNVGCVEAIAGGRALARQLMELGVEAHDSRDVVTLTRAGNPHAVRLVRQAGRLLGEVLASITNFFNPSVIVISGDIAHAHEQLFAGVREIVYQRSLPLATRHLRIVRSELDDRAGVIGAAVTAIEHVFSPEAVDATIASRAAQVSTA
ncbi:MAG TPA: ROK family transcriptional regulator [Actinomycetota bacterium]|jgi:predicted NBD/HSP70 family sugar kinase|nr:ROK family transcriptional regulator [Actinomycetota bacterium]